MVAGALFGIGFYTALLMIIRYARRGIVSARTDIVPLLPDGEAGFRRIYGQLSSPWPVLGIAALLSALFWTIGNQPEAWTPAHVVFIVLQLAIISLTTATVLWTFFMVFWGLRRLGREPLRLTPYTEDPMLGLRPLGQIAVSSSMVYFAMVIVVFVPLMWAPAEPLYLAFLLGLLALGVLLFVVPLLGLHRKMLEAKRAAQRDLALEAAKEWKAMRSPPADGASAGELRDLVLSLRGFVAHERAERKVSTLPTWPFDPQVTGRIAAIVLTGVVAVLGRAVVDWVLARP